METASSTIQVWSARFWASRRCSSDVLLQPSRRFPMKDKKTATVSNIGQSFTNAQARQSLFSATLGSCSSPWIVPYCSEGMSSNLHNFPLHFQHTFGSGFPTKISRILTLGPNDPATQPQISMDQVTKNFTWEENKCKLSWLALRWHLKLKSPGFVSVERWCSASTALPQRDSSIA